MFRVLARQNAEEVPACVVTIRFVLIFLVTFFIKEKSYASRQRYKNEN